MSLGEFGSVVVRRVRFEQKLVPPRPCDTRTSSRLDRKAARIRGGFLGGYSLVGGKARDVLKLLIKMAGGLGFEPRLAESESYSLARINRRTTHVGTNANNFA